MAKDYPSTPFPIFEIANRFLLFDINVISFIRREHNIGGVFIGNIPQATQQTLFSGIPLELMPEEVQWLVRKDYAYIVDDIAAHERMLGGLSASERQICREAVSQDGLEAARSLQSQAEERKKAHLRRSGSSADEEVTNPRAMHVTPTTSYPPLKTLDLPRAKLPPAPTSYPVFAHLHENGYFMGPGLRFGCQYVAYPGDPLRYHSHFLVTGHEWDEEIDLLDIVGGGRLGTGVKKGYMIGGAPKGEQVDDEGQVRVFSFEWAAM